MVLGQKSVSSHITRVQGQAALSLFCGLVETLLQLQQSASCNMAVRTVRIERKGAGHQSVKTFDVGGAIRTLSGEDAGTDLLTQKSQSGHVVRIAFERVGA